MADLTPRQNESVALDTRTLYKDMGDGTHAVGIFARAVPTEPLDVNVTNQIAIIEPLSTLITNPESNPANVNVVSGSTEIDVVTLFITPVISAAAAYAAGDALGDLLVFPAAVSEAGGAGIITKITIVDLDQELAPIDLVLFDQPFTPTADNAPFDPPPADMPFCLGYIGVAATDYSDFANNSVAAKCSGLQMPFEFQLADDITHLYGQLVIRGVHTYTTAADITIILTIERYV